MFPFRYSLTSNLRSWSNSCNSGMSKISPGASAISDQSSSNMVCLSGTNVVWHEVRKGTRGYVPLPQLSRTKEFFKLIGNSINQPIGGIEIEHITNPINAIIQIAKVVAHEITKCGSNVKIELVNLRSSRHRSGFVHVYTLGHQGAQHNPPCATSTIGTHVVVNIAAILVQCLTLRHEHVLDPSIESLGTFDDTKHEKLSAFGHIVLLPLLSSDHSNCSNECTEDLNTVHESVEVFLIINLGDHLHECISRRERFGQFHCWFGVASLCREFLNHESNINHHEPIRNPLCATISTGTIEYSILNNKN